MNRNKMWLRLFSLLPLVFLNVSCRKTPTGEGYRVVSFDSTTGKWIILRSGTFDGKYLTKRITAVCDFYEIENRGFIRGPNACILHVGQLIDTNNGLYVIEDPDRLSIIEGEGVDRVNQQFFILKNEVVPE